MGGGGAGAVDAEVGAGDEAGGGAGEEDDDAGDFLGGAEAAELVAGEGFGPDVGVFAFDFVPDAADEEDVAGGDDVAADSFWRPLVGEGFHVAHEGAFHGAVGSGAGVGGAGGDGDDGGGGRFFEEGAGFVGEVDGGEEVDFEHGAPIAAGGGDVGDEAIEAAEILGGLADPGAEGGFVADIDGGAEDLVAGFFPVGGGVGDGLGIAGAEGDVGAFVEEFLDDGAADALGSAGDEDFFAGEVEVHVFMMDEGGGGEESKREGWQRSCGDNCIPKRSLGTRELLRRAVSWERGERTSCRCGDPDKK